MSDAGARSMGPLFESWLWLAALLAGPALGLWLLWGRRPLLTPQRQRAVPWLLLDVALILLLSLLIDVLIYQALIKLGWQDTGAQLLTKLLTLPLHVALIILLPWARVGARPYQLGLTWQRCALNCLLGLLVWVVITPLVYGIYSLVLQTAEPSQHPVQKLLIEEPGAVTWMLVILVALVVAPLGEELGMRGLVQPALAKYPIASDLVAVLTFIALLGVNGVEIWEERNLNSLWRVSELVVVGPGYYAVCLATRHDPLKNFAFRGIFATSLLFAALHQSPTHVPLFLLSLVLGWLRYRTQSLVPAIVLHLLFNTVSLLPLMLKQSAAS